MKRRDFLKKGSIAASVIAAAGITGSGLSELYAKTKKNSKSFSFEIITDKPDSAIKLSEEFFKKYLTDTSVIKFTEYPVEGEMHGDIVFIQNGKLINYKSGSEEIKKEIRFIADDLSLPKKISGATRLRFHYSENNSAAKRFLVFHKNVLIKTINSDNENVNLDLSGTLGSLLLNIDNKKARVISSSCLHKTCVNSGSIAYCGESVVCIPNELMIVCE